MASPPMNLRREVRDVRAAEQPKRHEVIGLLLSALAVLTAMAVLSYDVRGGPDWAGPVGRRVAEVLLLTLGAAALLVPFSLAVAAMRMFRRTSRPVAVGRVLGTLAILATTSTALHLWLGEGPALGGLMAGGVLGATLGDTLRAFVGTAGAHTLVLTALLVALVARTRLSVVALATDAQAAGLHGGAWLRAGFGTVARAWRESKRSVPPPAPTAPRVKPETLAEEAVRPVIEDPDEPDDDVEDRSLVEIMLEQDERARVEEAKAAKKTRPSKKKAALELVDVSAAAAVVGPVTAALPVSAAAVDDLDDESVDDDTSDPFIAAVSAPAPAPAPVAAPKARRASVPPPVSVVAPVVAAEAPMADEVDDADVASAAPDAPTAPLKIVSHDHEIARAMKTAAVETEKSPAKVPAGEGRTMAMPPVSLLTAPPTTRVTVDEAQLHATAERLVKALSDYQIIGTVKEVHPGPVVTTYEVVPAAGTKVSRIAALSDDVAMSLEASKVRIVAPIPGKGRVGFEIPNAERQGVVLRELLDTEAFRNLGGALPVAIGKDVVGAPYYADLATMPHLIVAGATGQGKSVGLNVMLTSLLYKRGPDDVKMLMIDPKMVELAVYDHIPHMLLPVVTDMNKAALALRWVVDEMERRYSLFAQTGSRNISTYNERVAKAVAEGKPLRGLDGPVRSKASGTTTSLEEGAEAMADAPVPRKLPYILCVVDEFADLIMVAGKDIEAAVARLAQKARAAGIHVILATQRPSVDVITGVIKGNFPARIAFKVSQKNDSRVILDHQGAENLLGKGDMLILPPGSSDLRRIHCAYVSEDDVQRVTDHWREQGKPTYDEDILKPRDEDRGADEVDDLDKGIPAEKYEKAVQLVLSERKCSGSRIQRYLNIGYNTAARIVEKMEREGIVSAPRGPGKDREVLG